MDTAKGMGARVVRSQTMGDSIGCDMCIEPQLGVFNPKAFDAIDYAIKAAHDRRIRLIITLSGDCATCSLSGAGEYLKWLKKGDPKAFFTDPQIIDAFKAHISAVLNHRNSLTGVAYKDDPTILAWENCNLCSLGVAWTTTFRDMTPYTPWVDLIGDYIKSIDTKHLYLDSTGFFRYDKSVLASRTPDMVTWEYYQHWDKHFPGQTTNIQSFTDDATAITKSGKVYIVNEYGWDGTNWKTQQDLKALLTTLASDKRVSGDLYWALQSHATNFGWQAIPANTTNLAFARAGESGHWWSLYYGGLTTLVNTADDMQARAELLRTHAYVMADVPVPPHNVPAAPVITTKGRGLVGWRGSAGAVNYSVQRRMKASESWIMICDRCATDGDAPWIDPHAPETLGGQYRVIAYNADGTASEPSRGR
jgi:mannan endo-1,4-beta-mannosidase